MGIGVTIGLGDICFKYAVHVVVWVLNRLVNGADLGKMVQSKDALYICIVVIELSACNYVCDVNVI